MSSVAVQGVLGSSGCNR